MHRNVFHMSKSPDLEKQMICSPHSYQLGWAIYSCPELYNSRPSRLFAQLSRFKNDVCHCLALAVLHWLKLSESILALSRELHSAAALGRFRTRDAQRAIGAKTMQGLVHQPGQRQLSSTKIPPGAVQYSTVQYSTVQYSTV